MFDFKTVDNSIKFPNQIDVIEKKAPTDDSIRLAREFDEKSKEALVKSLQINDNNFNFGFIDFRRDFQTFDHVFYIKFSINGTQFIQKIQMCEKPHSKNAIDFIIEEISKNIAKVIFYKTIEEMEKTKPQEDPYHNPLKEFADYLYKYQK